MIWTIKFTLTSRFLSDPFCLNRFQTAELIFVLPDFCRLSIFVLPLKEMLEFYDGITTFGNKSMNQRVSETKFVS